MDTGNGGRCRNMERGVDTSDGGWWVVSVGDGQGDNALLRDRRRGTGVSIGVATANGC